MSIAYVALGANLGDRLETLRSARQRLDDAGEVIAVSSVYETDSVGFEDAPAYLNAVVKLETWLHQEELLEALLIIEAEFGRVRGVANAPRTLDLDLLLYDELIQVVPRLTLPHPRMHERAFVLVPLAEIAPGVILPGRNRTIRELRDDLEPISGVTRFAAL
jgi:2-amino-4-hydroxy-6-hydroxymethyldihydropteridine diphosphokinase